MVVMMLGALFDVIGLAICNVAGGTVYDDRCRFHIYRLGLHIHRLRVGIDW
jgi:hypothetical protein